MTVEPNDPTQAGTDWTDPGDDKVTLSWNEVETLCTKAARGAGMPWGLAEEAGFAAGWLVAQGINGPSALLAYLESEVTDCAGRLELTPQGGFKSDTKQFCPIALGTAISDHAGTGIGPVGSSRVPLGMTAAPVLILPFLAGAARRTGQTVCLEWKGGVVRVGEAGVSLSAGSELAGVGQAEITIHAISETEEMVQTPDLCRLDRGVIEALNRWAIKTTVPPSEKSRADAGAGESDND